MRINIMNKSYELDTDNDAHMHLQELALDMKSKVEKLECEFHHTKLDVENALRDLNSNRSPNPVGPIQNAQQIAAAAAEYDLLKRLVTQHLRYSSIESI